MTMKWSVPSGPFCMWTEWMFKYWWLLRLIHLSTKHITCFHVLSQLAGHGLNLNIGIFLDTRNEISVKLYLMVVVFPVHGISGNLELIFKGHSGVLTMKSVYILVSFF